ncbi:MAG: hypothetical protein JNL64_09320 [Blastocatellia bacterium]|nr:hypothetical protein [Blastocatellia bacterium]
MRFSTKFFKFLLLTMLMAALGLTAFGQKQKSKNDLLKELSVLLKSNTPEDDAKSYVIAKEYISRFGEEKDENTTKVKKFAEDYRQSSFLKAVDAKKIADAESFGKEILAVQPENTAVVINLAYAAFNATAAGDKAYAPMVVTYSKRAIELIEAGKLPPNFSPFTAKDDTLAWLNYFNASALQSTDLKSAAGYMWKATKYESNIRKTIEPFFFVAYYYEQVYEKLTKENADKARIEKCVDLMLDAYARSVRMAETTKDPKLNEAKSRFEQIYKFRKGTDQLMKEFIDITLSAPMPDPTSFN